MAVALGLDKLQSNDSKTIKFTDDTGLYDVSTNTGGWDGDQSLGNQDVQEIVATSLTTADMYWLELGIVYTDSSGNETTYDDIDLIENFATEFTSKEHGMEFELNMSHLKESGVAAGDSDDVFPDGVYDVTYTITEADAPVIVDTITYNYFVDGVIRTKVYDKLIDNHSTIFKQKQFSSDERNWQDLNEALFYCGEFKSLEAQINDATETKKLEILYYLEQELNN